MTRERETSPSVPRPGPSRLVRAEWLTAVIERAMAAHGMSDEHAAHAASALVTASLRGIDSHGVELLPIYLRELAGGRSNPRPALHRRERGAVLSLEADGALGPVAATIASDHAVELARRHGVGLVSVKNANHFGAACCYTLRIAAAGCVGLAFTHADALVAPHGGSAALLGTNPLSCAAPGRGDDVFCADLATSQISFSKLMRRLRDGGAAEPGWAVARSGETLERPDDFLALLPLGGYKGQALGMIVALLAGALTGSPFDDDLSHLFAPPFDQPRRIGQLFLAVDPSFLEGEADLRARVSELLRRTRARGDGVRSPGDRAAATAAERIEHGVPLPAPLFDELTALAHRHGL